MYEEINVDVPYTAAGTASRGQWMNTKPVALRLDLSTLRIQPDTAVSTDGTNYSTYTVKRYRAGTGTTLATFTTNSTGGAALTQWTPASMTLNAAATGTALELIQYDSIVVDKAESGSGKNGGALISVMATEDRLGTG